MIPRVPALELLSYSDSLHLGARWTAKNTHQNHPYLPSYQSRTWRVVKSMAVCQDLLAVHAKPAKPRLPSLTNCFNSDLLEFNSKTILKNR